MKCLRCNNVDPKYFYDDRGVTYCRKCVMFMRVNVNERAKGVKLKTFKGSCKMYLPYTLTAYQKEVMHKISSYLKKKQNVLVYAATGAGKTEMSMKAIEEYLNKSKKVCVAIARRQVVLELRQRYQEAFKNLVVIAVCEGSTKQIDADLIVCTMHQLYRYPQCFDLLIMDEIDAFPYAGNPVLQAIAMQSCRGQIMYLTATPDEELLQQVHLGTLEMVDLFIRPHGRALIIPIIVKGYGWLLWIRLLVLLKAYEQRKTLVFVPTIALAKTMEKIFSLYFSCASFTSKSEDKEQRLQNFREEGLQVLFTTTVLERGITIKGVEVIVFHAEHMVFSQASLIQIVGRVGRAMEEDGARAILLCRKKTPAIKGCIETLEKMNERSM